MSEGICNHLTARAPSLFKENGVVLIIPYGLYWSRVTPESLIGMFIYVLTSCQHYSKILISNFQIDSLSKTLLLALQILTI